MFEFTFNLIFVFTALIPVVKIFVDWATDYQHATSDLTYKLMCIHTLSFIIIIAFYIYDSSLPLNIFKLIVIILGILVLFMDLIISLIES